MPESQRYKLTLAYRGTTLLRGFDGELGLRLGEEMVRKGVALRLNCNPIKLEKKAYSSLAAYQSATGRDAHSVSGSPANRLVAQVLRLGTAIEHSLPRSPLGPANRTLARHLQREQRPREPLTPDQRDALIPRVADDVRRLEALTGESFAHWLDPHRNGTRSALAPQGRIGTAHNSIDRPIRE